MGRLTNAYQHGRPNQSTQALPAQRPYHALPTPVTKPKTMWSCMWNPLPNLTGSCARGAKPIGVFGLVMDPLPFPTNRPFWLHLHSLALLPNPTTWPVKDTHEQRTQHRPPHGSRGHRPVPQDDPVAGDSVRCVHPIQLIHIPPTHLRGTRAHTVKPTRDHTTPLRSVESHGQGAGDPHPTTTSTVASDCEYSCEAHKFGKEFLRMAGIVQMLHAHNSR